MQKLIKVALVVSVMFGSSGYISEQNVNTDHLLAVSTKDFINEESVWGKVKLNGSKKLGNETVELQVTYENPKESLNKFKSMYRKELTEIQIEEKFDELNDKNYQQYYSVFLEKGEQYVDHDNINNNFAFFDIYENDEQNRKLISFINQYQSRNNQADRNELLLEIMSYSPHYNQSLEDFVISQMPQTKQIIFLEDINVTNATNYAKKYAENINSAYNYYAGADCTNFASQIAYAGGLRGRIAAIAWKPYTGAWINANTFCGIWGRRGKSTKWSSFVKTLKPGDFIAADWGGDNHIDHIAYVAANGSSSSNKYIAQHSSNYYERSDQTNWPKESSTRVLWKAGNKG